MNFSEVAHNLAMGGQSWQAKLATMRVKLGARPAFFGMARVKYCWRAEALLARYSRALDSVAGASGAGGGKVGGFSSKGQKVREGGAGKVGEGG